MSVFFLCYNILNVCFLPPPRTFSSIRVRTFVVDNYVYVSGDKLISDDDETKTFLVRDFIDLEACSSPALPPSLPFVHLAWDTKARLITIGIRRSVFGSFGPWPFWKFCIRSTLWVNKNFNPPLEITISTNQLQYRLRNNHWLSSKSTWKNFQKIQVKSDYLLMGPLGWRWDEKWRKVYEE